MVFLIDNLDLEEEEDSSTTLPCPMCAFGAENFKNIKTLKRHSNTHEAIHKIRCTKCFVWRYWDSNGNGRKFMIEHNKTCGNEKVEKNGTSSKSPVE